jgi:hypothetical protein
MLPKQFLRRMECLLPEPLCASLYSDAAVTHATTASRSSLRTVTFWNTISFIKKSSLRIKSNVYVRLARIALRRQQRSPIHYATRLNKYLKSNRIKRSPLFQLGSLDHGIINFAARIFLPAVSCFRSGTWERSDKWRNNRNAGSLTVQNHIETETVLTT